MLKINNNMPKVPFRTKIQINKEKKELKKLGYNNFELKVNKKGDSALLGYNTPEHDELVVSSVIRPNGNKRITTYKTFPEKRQNNEPYTKIIESWERGKNGRSLFNKRVTVRYNGFSKIPEMYSVFKRDIANQNKVEINTKYPFNKYSI